MFFVLLLSKQYNVAHFQVLHFTLFVVMDNESIVIGKNTLCGKNDLDNWKIISDSDTSHTWLHLNSFPSPHVIIRSENPSKDEIEYAAKLCKEKSKFKNVRNLKVVYTKVGNLSFGSETGSVVFGSKRKCSYVKI